MALVAAPSSPAAVSRSCEVDAQLVASVVVDDVQLALGKLDTQHTGNHIVASSAISTQNNREAADTSAECKAKVGAGDVASLDELCARVAELYPKTLFLRKAYNKIQQYCKQHAVTWQDLQPAFQQHGIDLASLIADATLQQAALDDLQDESGWTVIRDDDLRLLHKHVPGEVVHSFKGECTLQAPMIHPLALARETDLVKQWNEYVEDSILLQEEGDSRVMVYAAVWAPWPLSSRDMVAQALGCDMLEERGCLLVTFQSPDDSAVPQGRLPAEAKDRCRVQLMPRSCTCLQPLPPTTPGGLTLTRVSVIAHLDINMPSLPDALLHFILKVFAPFMYKTALRVLRKSFADPRGPLRQRLVQRAGLYELLQQRVDGYLAGELGVVE